MYTAYINIGSNVGDRPALIGRTVAAIEKTLGGKAEKAPMFESAPWGYESALPFLNLGIAISTDLKPAQLLDTLLQIQASIDASPHRDDDGNYVDRKIDIDLIAMDSIVVEGTGSDLILPHPRMHLRPFVLIPMRHLAPHWIHPVLHKSIDEMISAL